MARTIIEERRIGTRTIMGTDYGIYDQLVKDQRPGSQPEWLIVHALCNGVPDGSDSYRRLRDARDAWDASSPDMVSYTVRVRDEDVAEILAATPDDAAHEYARRQWAERRVGGSPWGVTRETGVHGKSGVFSIRQGGSSIEQFHIR